MLNCVYHPVKEMRLVEDFERDNLLKSGEWFDSPKEALDVKKKCIEKINKENKKKKE